MIRNITAAAKINGEMIFDFDPDSDISRAEDYLRGDIDLAEWDNVKGLRAHVASVFPELNNDELNLLMRSIRPMWDDVREDNNLPRVI